MATWPAYANVALDSYSETRSSTVLRTEMDDGPVKQARKSTRPIITRQVVVQIYSSADYLAFMTWVRDTINGGADSFTFNDPIRGNVDARIVNAEIKTEIIPAAKKIYRLSMQLESYVDA